MSSHRRVYVLALPPPQPGQARKKAIIGPRRSFSPAIPRPPSRVSPCTHTCSPTPFGEPHTAPPIVASTLCAEKLYGHSIKPSSIQFSGSKTSYVLSPSPYCSGVTDLPCPRVEVGGGARDWSMTEDAEDSAALSGLVGFLTAARSENGGG